MAEEVKVFDWDDEIEKESEFTLLEEGDYDFEITGFERGQYDGSDKMPACKMATVSFKVTDDEGNYTTIQDRYYLCGVTEWKISQLFKAVGLKKSGEKIKMDWNALPGKKGRCKVIVTTSSKGNEFNNIKTLYAKEEEKDGGGAWD